MGDEEKRSMEGEELVELEALGVDGWMIEWEGWCRWEFTRRARTCLGV